MTPLGRLLREAVIEECLDSLPVVMTLPEFAVLLGVDERQVGDLVAAGRVRGRTVGERTYVFPASCWEVLFEAGMLCVPLDPSRGRALVHGSRVVASVPPAYARSGDGAGDTGAAC